MAVVVWQGERRIYPITTIVSFSVILGDCKYAGKGEDEWMILLLTWERRRLISGLVSPHDWLISKLVGWVG